MPDTTTTADILAAADQLGRLIAKHPAVEKLTALLKQLEDDTDAKRLLTDLDRHSQSLAEKEAKGSAIEVSDKHKLRDLQQAVAMNPLLGQFQMAQMDYVDLMRKVDEKLAAGTPGV